MSKWTGWQIMNIDEVAPIVSTALRLYSVHRPALNMRSCRHNLDDRVPEWRIRCDGKQIGSVVLRPVAHGIRLVHITIRQQPNITIYKLARRRMHQIFLHVKNRIDREHQVGVHWKVRDIANDI